MPENSGPDDDLDPSLLREAGRASAIQHLANKAEKMGDRAYALEKSTQAALATQVGRWRRTTFILAVALLILIVIAAIDLRIAQDNGEILEDVDRLVAFVDEVEASRDSDNEDGVNPEVARAFAAIYETRDLLCQHPDFQQACAETDT